MIYAGANDACWMQDDATSHRYNCFRPDKQGESFIYFGESDQDASIDHQETVNTAELYADVIEAIEQDRAPYVDAYAGKNALELVLAIYKSQKEGRAVKLPLENFASIDMKGEF